MHIHVYRYIPVKVAHNRLSIINILARTRRVTDIVVVCSANGYDGTTVNNNAISIIQNSQWLFSTCDMRTARVQNISIIM